MRCWVFQSSAIAWVITITNDYNSNDAVDTQRPRTMNKQTKSRAVISAQESWASSISDYILLRRQQTHTAYRAANADSKDIDDLSASCLFTAMFSVLATYLEEGHTVLTIETKQHEQPLQGSINGMLVTLYPWQQQLLEILVTPILALVETQIEAPSDSATAKLSLFTLLDTLFTKRAQLWAPLTLTGHERELLIKRFNTVEGLYDLLKGNEITSFMAFIDSHTLFARFDAQSSINSINKNSLSKNNKPIIYKIAESAESVGRKDKTISLTFWLHRAWQAEFNLAHNIKVILDKTITPLPISIPKNLNEQQKTAVDIANNNAFSIITGGPGTGKTYTVAQLVIALQQAAESREGRTTDITFSTDSASLALAAPTGKAAQRMQESLQKALDAAKVELQLQEAKTIHRLLGIGRTGRPRYDANNPLGEEIIIVDEASMLGVELANYLVSAVKPGARLILLGDANQLAAVEAGAVLADLCRIPSLQAIHAQLTQSQRFGKDSGIGKLAYEINKPDTDTQAIWQLLKQDTALNFVPVHSVTVANLNTNQIKNSLSNKKTLKKIQEQYLVYISYIKNLTENERAKSIPYTSIEQNISTLIQIFNQFRVLTAGHHGEWGDHFINNYLTQWHLAELKLPLGQNTWFHGRPIMVLQNNYELGLFNGDIGFCLQTANGELEVFFENKTQGIAVNLLNEEVIATAYAMTIHKSQGSEFDHVVITFDNSHARLLSKELIYTAVTRAKKQVTIFSTQSALETAVQTPTERHTGLALQF